MILLVLEAPQEDPEWNSHSSLTKRCALTLAGHRPFLHIRAERQRDVRFKHPALACYWPSRLQMLEWKPQAFPDTFQMNQPNISHDSHCFSIVLAACYYPSGHIKLIPLKKVTCNAGSTKRTLFINVMWFIGTDSNLSDGENCWLDLIHKILPRYKVIPDSIFWMDEINNGSQSRIKLLSLYSPKTDKRDDSKNKQTTKKKNPRRPSRRHLVMHNSCLLKTWQVRDGANFLWSFHFGH